MPVSKNCANQRQVVVKDEILRNRALSEAHRWFARQVTQLIGRKINFETVEMKSFK